ncbi:MAG TPA: glycosyltransferase [Candidatus Limnocylindria bacterium]|nr:glycosyltransferase [Candidatus Limnocylindria bacterium]
MGTLDPARPRDLRGGGARVTPRSRRGVAIVHDWLTGMRGGEKVLEAICELYPDAPIYTLVHDRGSVSPALERRVIRTSLVQWLPAAGRLYRNYLPAFPTAVEFFDLDRYDLVISSSHCAAKAVLTPGATHVCYCHSPMRYAWDQFPAYFGPEQVGPLRSKLLSPILAGLARWDAGTAGRVDRFLANSQYVAGRIRRYYNRGSAIVYPPVDTEHYRLPEAGCDRDAGFVIVSALVPYKRVDLAIEACRQVGVPLTVVGRGPEEARLRALAGADVRFAGWRSDDEVRDLYRRATAVLLPGVEDFGLVPVEAQACGTPVVAFGAGGALETVVEGVTGLLVREATVEAFAEALARMARARFDPAVIRANAERFSQQRFMTEFQAAVDAAVHDKAASR